MGPPLVTLVLPPDDAGVRIIDGVLIDRTTNALAIALAGDVAVPAAVTPGQAVVVVVRDEPAEVLLAIGLAPDGPADHLRLRLVERRA